MVEHWVFIPAYHNAHRGLMKICSIRSWFLKCVVLRVCGELWGTGVRLGFHLAPSHAFLKRSWPQKSSLYSSYSALHVASGSASFPPQFSNEDGEIHFEKNQHLPNVALQNSHNVQFSHVLTHFVRLTKQWYITAAVLGNLMIACQNIGRDLTQSSMNQRTLLSTIWSKTFNF